MCLCSIIAAVIWPSVPLVLEDDDSSSRRCGTAFGILTVFQNLSMAVFPVRQPPIVFIEHYTCLDVHIIFDVPGPSPSTGCRSRSRRCTSCRTTMCWANISSWPSREWCVRSHRSTTSHTSAWLTRRMGCSWQGIIIAILLFVEDERRGGLLRKHIMAASPEAHKPVHRIHVQHEQEQPARHQRKPTYPPARPDEREPLRSGAMSRYS
jgi:hypothetical protein